MINLPICIQYIHLFCVQIMITHVETKGSCGGFNLSAVALGRPQRNCASLFTAAQCFILPVHTSLKQSPSGRAGRLCRMWWQWRSASRLLCYKWWSDRHECDPPIANLFWKGGTFWVWRPSGNVNYLIPLAERAFLHSDCLTKTGK